MSKTLNTAAKVKAFATRVQAHHNQLMGGNNFEQWMKNDVALEKELEETQKGLPKGLCVGKVVRWGVADGYATYLISKVGKKICKLEHLPFGDGYRFMGVANGEALIGSIYVQ